MAKKVVATLKTGTGKNFTKCIKMVKSDKTGAYMFKEGNSEGIRSLLFGGYHCHECCYNQHVEKRMFQG